MIQERHGLSERRACRLLGQPRSTQRRALRAVPDEEERGTPGPSAPEKAQPGRGLHNAPPPGSEPAAPTRSEPSTSSSTRRRIFGRSRSWLSPASSRRRPWPSRRTAPSRPTASSVTSCSTAGSSRGCSRSRCWPEDFRIDLQHLPATLVDRVPHAPSSPSSSESEKLDSHRGGTRHRGQVTQIRMSSCRRAEPTVRRRRFRVVTSRRSRWSL